MALALVAIDITGIAGGGGVLLPEPISSRMVAVLEVPPAFDAVTLTNWPLAVAVGVPETTPLALIDSP